MPTIQCASMVVALAVLAMVAGTSKGVVLSKCEVRDHMQQAFNRLPKQVLLMIDAENLIAKSEYRLLGNTCVHVFLFFNQQPPHQ